MRRIKARYAAAGSMLVIALAAAWGVSSAYPTLAASLRYYYEREELALHPSAQLAYELGMRHFRATEDPANYNRDRAAYFFERALALDPSYPFANHQLARINFIAGNFATALILIDHEITIQGEKNPNAYYVRGLIEGYSGNYVAAVADYKHFLQLNPHVWAGYNDTAWVLMKAGRFPEAIDTLRVGLNIFPDNPWLLNSLSVALYETGDVTIARPIAERALVKIGQLTSEDWLRADPGNDPRIAQMGLETFRTAAEKNLHNILGKAATSSLKMP